MTKNIQENNEPVFSPKGGKPGYTVNGKWYPVDKKDLNTPQLKAELQRYAKLRGKSQLEKDQASLSKPKPDPAKPVRPSQKPTTQAPPAAPSTPRGRTPAAAKPAPAKPAPESPAVREYMKAAAAARKSGDAAQMAKVRDTGLDIWRKKYANTLAKNVTPAGTQRGTGQSVMAKQADELRALRPAAPQSTTSTPEPQAQSKLSGGAYSPAATARMSQRTKNVLGVKEQYDAYDLVLEYLFSQGHVDTLEEALYVMMEMSSETVQGIVESPGEWFRGILNPNNSAASRAQNTSPFSRPTAPLPSYTSPFAKPASRTDSGKLTTYGAGGGAAAERSGQTRDQVMRQGAKNVENKNKSQANPGPNFGR